MDLAPCLVATAIQSTLVSPLPITKTFLPFAVSAPLPVFSKVLVFCVKKSRANSTPFSFLPSISRSIGLLAPVQSTKASNYFKSLETLSLLSIFSLTLNSIPLSLSKSTRLSTILLSSFISGIPYIKSPPTLSLLSKTLTL